MPVLFLLPYLFSTYFFILLRLCFFVILRSWKLFAAVIVTETSCALFSFSYFFSHVVIRHSSPAFLSSSITSSPRVRTTFSSLLLPFYLFLCTLFSSVLTGKNHTETSCTLFAFSYSYHGHASLADTIFFLTLLFGICHSSSFCRHQYHRQYHHQCRHHAFSYTI